MIDHCTLSFEVCHSIHGCQNNNKSNQSQKGSGDKAGRFCLSKSSTVGTQIVGGGHVPSFAAYMAGKGTES